MRIYYNLGRPNLSQPWWLNLTVLAVRKKVKRSRLPSAIFVTVDPRPPEARILVVDHQGNTLMKARFNSRPILPRALPTLLEALSMWMGTPAQCALVVGPEEPWCDMGSFGVYGDERDRTPLYQIEAVSSLRRSRRGNDITGMGEFRDLRQMEFCLWTNP